MALSFIVGYAVAFIGIVLVLTVKTIKEKRYLASLGSGAFADGKRRVAHQVNLRWFPFLIAWNTFLFGSIFGALGYVFAWITS